MSFESGMGPQTVDDLCEGCGGSGYSPPYMLFDGRELSPGVCDHCDGDGLEPGLTPEEIADALRGILTHILATIK